MTDKILQAIKLIFGGGLIVLLFFFTFIQKIEVDTDFNEDGIPEIVQHIGREVKVISDNKIIYKSDPKLNVVEFIVADLNNDGNNNLALYLWKTGNYGEALPFWEEENDNSYKLHLFLYEWRDGGLKPLWHSSNLPYNNVKTVVKNIDNKNELIVLERPYSWGRGVTGEYIAIWKWDEWGFTLQERSEKGVYDDNDLLSY